MRRILQAIVSGFLIVGTHSNIAEAQCLREQLAPSDTCSLDPFATIDKPCTLLFGAQVILSGERLVIGAEEVRPADQPDQVPQSALAAFIFKHERGEWTYEAKIADENTGNVYQGAAYLSIDGERLVLGSAGAPNLDRITGAAYVYQHDTAGWHRDAKLVASDADNQTVGNFGAVVSIAGDVIVVGAPATEGVGPFTGAAFVFRRNSTTWIQESKIIPLDLTDYALFGSAVATNGERIAVAATFERRISEGEDTTTIGRAGVVYVYRFDETIGWVQEARLTGPDPGTFDAFGTAIGMTDDRLAISDTTSESTAGVHVFRRDNQTWVHEATLHAPTGNLYGQFGSSLSLYGERLAVGDIYGISILPVPRGAMHLFRLSSGTWQHEATITEPNNSPAPPAGTSFGASVAVGDGIAVAGPYVYALDGIQCDPNATQPHPGGADNGQTSGGSAPRLCGAGSMAAILGLLCLRCLRLSICGDRTVRRWCVALGRTK